ncbi:SOS response-associated peptidase [Ruminiclostridium josui]|uniref:SOS response-associated peptidase n=1 Tax=Ruminiclostridium josui TaxID=1499 RepID=UPI000463CED1|nr:SOS response-associated peptidase [Ruminiclostridium josui]
MCGRYAIFTEEENQELRNIVNDINEKLKGKATAMKTGEIFPTDTVPVITDISSDGKKTTDLFKWGFPHFKQSSGVIINARSETVHEKPTFRKLLISRRCIIPASGFYEWRKVNSKKEKYFISSATSNVIYMAGLYNSFIDNTGAVDNRFVILTTDANQQMSYIHNRMPVILRPEDSFVWLDCNSNYLMVSKFFKPYAGDILLSQNG